MTIFAVHYVLPVTLIPHLLMLSGKTIYSFLIAG